MAVIYLRSSDGSDASDGLTWANAKATLAAALTAAGAGGTVYVSDNHAETQASGMSLTSPGTAASPTRVICVDDAGDPEPPTALATTATVSTTGANTMTFVGGVAWVYGITFSAGSGAADANLNWGNSASANWIFESCTLKLNATNSNIMGFGDTASRIFLRNTTLHFTAVGQILRLDQTRLTMVGGAIAGTAPTSLLGSVLSTDLDFIGVDLSLMGSGKNLVNVISVTKDALITFENCKLGSSVTVATGTFTSTGGAGSAIIRVVNCDSADTNYRYHRQNYFGTITQESTIVRTGGASDGTTPISRKMVSTANTKIYAPLVLDDYTYWNETTGSAQTATMEIITDNVTLTDAECWLEVEYLGTSGFPLSSLVHDRVTDPVFGTPANQTSSSVAWTTTGLTTPVKQKLSVAFTAQEKGAVRVRVMLAKASTTVYVDPKATVA